MNMKALDVSVPSDVLLALNESENQFVYDMKLFTAIRFYQMKKLTLGKAAKLAEMTRFEFETMLSEFHIPISTLDFEDIEKDIFKLERI